MPAVLPTGTQTPPPPPGNHDPRPQPSAHSEEGMLGPSSSPSDTVRTRPPGRRKLRERPSPASGGEGV